jgi:hypothetical protein
VELEVDEDGGLRVFMSRLSDDLRSASAGAGGQRLLISGAVTYARQFVALTAAAADHAGYLGNWILAAGATGMQGLPVHEYLLRGRSGPRQDAPEYLRSTTASYAELIRQPGTVTGRLIGRLLRATGTYDLYAGTLADPPETALSLWRGLSALPWRRSRGEGVVLRPRRLRALAAPCRWRRALRIPILSGACAGACAA